MTDDAPAAPTGGAEAMPAFQTSADLADPQMPAPARPDYVPDKFWDEGAGAVRVEALAKSYAALERRFGGRGDGVDAVPASADGYRIETQGDLIDVDPEVNAMLHRAGFTGAQAQLVYDLAAERLMPMVGEIASTYEAKRQIDKLETHFGGPERWHEVRHQVAHWGRSHFAPEVFHALSTTAEGVLAMHRMMAAGEPGLMQGDGAVRGDDEASLRDLMRDPRYWRHREPGIVNRVRDGFRRLYPD